MNATFGRLKGISAEVKCIEDFNMRRTLRRQLLGYLATWAAHATVQAKDHMSQVFALANLGGCGPIYEGNAWMATPT